MPNPISLAPGKRKEFISRVARMEKLESDHATTLEKLATAIASSLPTGAYTTKLTNLETEYSQLKDGNGAEIVSLSTLFGEAYP